MVAAADVNHGKQRHFRGVCGIKMGEEGELDSCLVGRLLFKSLKRGSIAGHCTTAVLPSVAFFEIAVWGAKKLLREKSRALSNVEGRTRKIVKDSRHTPSKVFFLKWVLFFFVLAILSLTTTEKDRVGAKRSRGHWCVFLFRLRSRFTKSIASESRAPFTAQHHLWVIQLSTGTRVRYIRYGRSSAVLLCCFRGFHFGCYKKHPCGHPSVTTVIF